MGHGATSFLKIAKLSDAKNNLSQLVDRVRRGERVRITVRGLPVADLVPIDVPSTGDADEDSVIASALRRGVIARAPRGDVPRQLLRPGPRPLRGKSTSEQILDERKSGW